MGAEGDNNFDLRQAYIQLGPKLFNATLGRQTLAYGDERLIGISEWNNFSRTFDAAKLHYENEKGKFSVDLFASTVVYIINDSFDQSDLFNGAKTHRDQIFSGIYASTTAVNPVTMDFYVLVLDEDNPTLIVPGITYPGTSLSVPGTHTAFVTLGARIKADPKKLHGWEYEGEFAFQGGQVSNLDLTAFAALHRRGIQFRFSVDPASLSRIQFRQRRSQRHRREHRDLPEPLSIEPQVLWHTWISFPGKTCKMW